MKNLFVFILLINFINANTKSWTCLTPYEPGQCIPIKECTTIWRISTMAPRPLTIQIMNFLRDSVCGNPLDRTVCCRNQDVSAAFSNQLVATDVSQHKNIKLLDQINCGVAPVGKTSVGRTTSLYEFPWMALLGYEDGNTKGPEWRCSGTVINRRWDLFECELLSGFKFSSFQICPCTGTLYTQRSTRFPSVNKSATRWVWHISQWRLPASEWRVSMCSTRTRFHNWENDNSSRVQ